MVESLEPIPKAEELIKKSFEERYRSILGDRYEEFISYSLSYIKKSIRVNTIKATVKNVYERLSKNWILEPVPWCKEGFFIRHRTDERRDIGNLIEHTLGYIYIQEAASMIPAVALAPKPDDIILDMCAAPGSKTTQLAAMMKNKGVLISNDADYRRIPPLSFNIQRMGITNTVITIMDGTSKFNIEFDKILLDAPCSGTGNIRKSLKTLTIWNPNMVRRIAGIQKRLILNAFSSLKGGGVMIYSTCTLEPEENEGVIDFLLKKEEQAVIEDINIDIKRSLPILSFNGVEYDKRIKKCLRIWPQDNNTSGFFVARIRKKP